MSSLPDGWIFEVARKADIQMRGHGAKRACRCPFHDDRTPSAFLSANNFFHCAVCTPGSSLRVREFAERLRVEWRSPRFELARRPPSRGDAAPVFTAEHARRVWEAAYRRAFDERHPHDDRAVYAFLHERGLERSWNDQEFGILGPDMALPNELPAWVDRGYRLVVPLYDQHGSIINVQARNVFGNTPKTMFPSGSHAKGAVFANRSALELLRLSRRDSALVIFGEGLTDFLALSSALDIAVVSVPGISMAQAAIGHWVNRQDVILALDTDDAGARARLQVARAARRLGASRVAWIEWPSLCKDACDLVARCGDDGLALFLAEQLQVRVT